MNTKEQTKQNHELVKGLHFSEEEQQRFLAKLWELLRWQAGRYNGTDSTSMPIEKAQELLASLMYTLSVAVREENKNVAPEDLLQSDFRKVLKRGQSILERRKKEGEAAWNALCLEAPQINNVFYVSTIRNLGLFFKRYDIFYAAHEIPCSIDYPLLDPVPEDLQGISFIEEYIRRVRIESRLINHCPLGAVLCLLKNTTGNIREDYLNLCGPVLTNALGRCLLGYDLGSLELSRDDVARLDQRFFAGRTKEEILTLLTKAAEDLCVKRFVSETMSVFEKTSVSERTSVYKSQYFLKEIESLAVRSSVASETGCLENIFVPSGFTV